MSFGRRHDVRGMQTACTLPGLPGFVLVFAPVFEDVVRVATAHVSLNDALGGRSSHFSAGMDIRVSLSVSLSYHFLPPFLRPDDIQVSFPFCVEAVIAFLIE